MRDLADAIEAPPRLSCDSDARGHGVGDFTSATPSPQGSKVREAVLGSHFAPEGEVVVYLEAGGRAAAGIVVDGRTAALLEVVPVGDGFAVTSSEICADFGVDGPVKNG